MKWLPIFFLLIVPGIAFAQKMPDYGLYKIRITDTGKTITAEVNPVSSMPDVRPTLVYYWYRGEMIHTLQGGFSGKLLNGAYEEFYMNKNLKTQGTFEKGLKDGLWKEWDENGKLIQEISWNKGTKDGPFSLYTAEGAVKESGAYKNNLLNGRIHFYSGADSLKTVRYKNGLVEADDKPSFLKRLIPFKKKTKNAAKQP